MKKIIAILMLAAMLVTAVACSTPSGPAKDTDPAATTAPNAVTTDAPVTEAPKFVPSGKTYDQADFVILVASLAADAFNDFKFNETDPTVLDNAVQQKNTACEEMYDIVLDYVEDFGSSSGAFGKMRQEKTAGTVGYHLSFIPGQQVANLAYTGLLYDLHHIDTLDLENEWWDQNANKELSVCNNLYFTTGDISVWDDMQQFCVSFSKELFREKGYNTADLYKLVMDGKFTYETVYGYVKDVSEDMDGNEIMDMNDRYGILTWDDSIYGVMSSTGSKIVSKDKDTDTLVLTLTGDEAVYNTLTRYTEMIGEMGINYQRHTNGGNLGAAMFTEARAMFFFGRLSSLQNWRDMDTDYGILPYPKLSENQDRYYTITSSYHTNYFCTLALDEDIEMRGEIADALAYLSMEHMTPAYHERTLVGTLVRDDESLAVLPLLAANRIYDYGYIAQPGKINGQLIYTFRDMKTNYMSSIEKYKTIANRDITKINGEFEKLKETWN
ncbi:MAG: hypothetical protein IJN63_02750 [Clostridia bacterium]|nr:hypothetical protein [Clostridia bacterium]